jgi:hypothetical protein
MTGRREGGWRGCYSLEQNMTVPTSYIMLSVVDGNLNPFLHLLNTMAF